MDQHPAVAFTVFAEVWPRTTETEIGAALCAIGAGRTLTFFDRLRAYATSKHQSVNLSICYEAFGIYQNA